MSESSYSEYGKQGLTPLAAAIPLAVVLLLVPVAYRLWFQFDCRAAMPAGVCSGLSLAGLRMASVSILVGMHVLMRPKMRSAIQPCLRPLIPARFMGLTGLGILLMLTPLLWQSVWSEVRETAYPAFLVMIFWLSGMGLTVLGLVRAFTNHTLLFKFAVKFGPTLAPTILVGLILPDLALATQSLWRIDALTNVTFATVAITLRWLGQAVVTDTTTKLVQIDEFAVLVGPQCSGVEGFALIIGFVGMYLMLFRDKLNLARAALLIPAGLVLSWILNIVRIDALVLIGRYHSPDLALDGFHSYAGWAMFLGIAVFLIWLSVQVPWFQRTEPSPEPAQHLKAGLLGSGSAPLILPFAIFMGSAAVIPLFSEAPALLYPFRMTAVCLALWFARDLLVRIDWRVDALSLGAGALIGAAWVVTAPVAEAPDAILSAKLATVPPMLFALWVAIRLVGTSLIVPIVEELFFRGYVLRRLRGSTVTGAIVALVVSSALFAFLHDRVVAAMLAGLVFGWLYMRRDNIGHAITAHASANAIIAGVALAREAWHLI